jgi:hypothetical protein
VLLLPAAPAPTNLGESTAGQQVLHSWAAENSRRYAGFEVRRGGWILGQRVGTTGPGGLELPPSFQFGSFSFDADENGPYGLQVRAFRGNRQYGAAGSRSVLSDAPNTILYEVHLHDVGSTGWESASLTGFNRDTPSAGTGLTDDNFTNTPLVDFTLPALRRAEECILIVCWEAEQVYPNLGTDDGTPLGSRWTAEGPLWTYDGELSNAIVRCAVSYSTTASAPSLPSAGFRAAPVTMQRARVLLRFSRSSLTLGIKLKRMYVAVLRTNKPRLDIGEIQALL